MNMIEIQDYACKLAYDCIYNTYGHKPLNIYDVFPVYEMIIEDFNYRQAKLIDEECEKYFNEFVEIKNISDGDTQEFYISSAYQGE